jgi:hypothetical protein
MFELNEGHHEASFKLMISSQQQQVGYEVIAAVLMMTRKAK